MNSSINYPIFTYNNESIVLMPGSRFTKKELNSRLHQMNIDANNIQDKNTLVNLYESSLQNHQNKLKIFDRLRKDTEILNSKLGTSQRQSIQASNMNTMSNNSKNKILNISYNVQPFNPNNSRVQEINIVKESRINRDENPHNPLISSKSNQESNKTANFGQPTLVLKNSYNESIIDSGNFENNYNNNTQNSINNSKRFINNSNINNSYYNNNTSNVNYQNQSQYDNSMTNMNDNRNSMNNMNNNNILNKSNISNLNKSKAYNQHYQEEINTDINTSNNYNNNNNRYFQQNFSRNQKNNSIQPSQYQENNQSMQRSGNDNFGNSFQNQENNESIFRSGNNNISSINNDMNNTNTNYNIFKDTNLNQNQNRMYVESQGQPILSTGGEEQISNNRPYKRDLDEESNFSIFSTFKNSPLFKNRKEICLNVLIGIIIICFAIGTLSLVINSWESIINFFSEFFNLLTDPRRLIVDVIFGFISSVFFGSIEYFYITIPLIILIIILIIYIYNYNIKKICKKIYKQIYDDLINGNSGSEMNLIYEEEMYRRYAQSYGITQNEFERSYLPMLRKMRRKDSKMKTGCDRNNNGKELTYWFLNN